MMLEAQFGSEISPIVRPRIPASNTQSNGTTNGKAETETGTEQPTPPAAKTANEKSNSQPEHKDKLINGKDDETATMSEQELAEIARLQSMGIPVPGIEIRVDKHVAHIWLEMLEVECSNNVLRDRVKMVVERAMETVSGMWALGRPTSSGSSPVAATNGKG